MMKKVVLIGLGAVGLTYAAKLVDKCDFYVLVNKERMEKYQNNPPYLNGEKIDFHYILPSEKFDADLIIITVKSSGLDSAISAIKNFIGSGTRIISLINGISSEEKILEAYPHAIVLKSYFIGHSAVRTGNKVTQDGTGEIVLEHDEPTERFFKEAGINYSVPENINYSMWLKYTFNLFSNQISAILNMTFGEMKNNMSFIEFARKIIKETAQIAEKKGIKGLENLETDAINSLDKMCDDGKTSMLQDILAKRPTEVDIFAGEIIRLGQEYGIETPYNKVLYDLIKIKEQDNEYSFHTR